MVDLPSQSWRQALTISWEFPTTLISLFPFSGCKRKRTWNGAWKHLPEAKITFSVKRTLSLTLLGYWGGVTCAYVVVFLLIFLFVPEKLLSLIKLVVLWFVSVRVCFVFKEIRTLCSICSLLWQQVKIWHPRTRAGTVPVLFKWQLLIRTAQASSQLSQEKANSDAPVTVFSLAPALRMALCSVNLCEPQSTWLWRCLTP